MHATFGLQASQNFLRKVSSDADPACAPRGV